MPGTHSGRRVARFREGPRGAPTQFVVGLMNPGRGRVLREAKRWHWDTKPNHSTLRGTAGHDRNRAGRVGAWAACPSNEGGTAGDLEPVARPARPGAEGTHVSGGEAIRDPHPKRNRCPRFPSPSLPPGAPPANTQAPRATSGSVTGPCAAGSAPGLSHPEPTSARTRKPGSTLGCLFWADASADSP